MSFYFSKIFWVIINPLNIIFLLILIGIISHFFLKHIIYKFFYFTALIAFIIIAVLPTGNFMYYHLEKKFHIKPILPDTIDGILILSGATNPVLSKEHNQIHLNDAVERLTESIILIHKYPKAKVIFSGGSGQIDNQELTHANVARDFYEKLEIDTSKIFFESESRNTYENILFSKKIMQPTLNENWLIITSAFHMIRASNIGESLEWNFIPYAVDFKSKKKLAWNPSMNFLNNITNFQLASHEWIGLIAYYLMGRTSKIY